MKQILLTICIFFSLTSCEIQYDGETKIVVTGKIIDQNGIPIPEKKIDITVSGESTLFSPSDLISYGKSDQNGNFTLIFPAPKGEYDFTISINNLINQTSEYQAKDIIARKNNFENYKLDLNEITLFKNESITNLKLVLNKVSSNKQLKDILIEGKQANSHIELNSIQNDSDYLQTNYFVIKNQTIILKYTVVDLSGSSTPTTHSISIPINNDAITYTISY